MSDLRTVGRTQDGQVVQAAHLSWPGGLAAEVWSRGAMLRSLAAPAADGRRAEVLQVPADLAAAEADDAYHDLVIGPVANRIAGETERVALTTGAVISATRMAFMATAVPSTVGCTLSTLSAYAGRPESYWA